MYHTVFDATISSFATSSAEVNLGKGFKNVWVEVPTMTSNSTLHVQVANASGGTYRRLVEKDPASAAASVDYQINSATTNRIVACPPAGGLRFLKMESVAVLSAAVAFKIICSDDN